MRFEEIADRNAAEQWRDRYLLVPGPEAAARDPGEVYLPRPGRMRVERSDGRELGRVEALYEVPQGVLLEVATDHGSTDVTLSVAAWSCGRSWTERRWSSTLPAGLLDDDRVRLSIDAAHYRGHDLSRLLSRAAVAEHSGAGCRGGSRDLSRRRPPRLHARPAPDRGRLPVRWWGGDGDDASAVLRGGGGTRGPPADRAAVGARGRTSRTPTRCATPRARN